VVASTNQRTIEPSNQQTNKPTNQRTIEPSNQQTNEPTNQRTNEPTNQRTNEYEQIHRVGRRASKSTRTGVDNTFCQRPFTFVRRLLPTGERIHELGLVAIENIGLWFGMRAGENENKGERTAAAQKRNHQ